ncbi:MAG: arginine--tRNA ligase [Patescibacteria group bacterium]
MEETLKLAIRNALDEMGAADVSFALEWPADLAHGDFATNAAMAAAKTLGRNPRELAADLAQKLKDALGEKVASVEAAGPGFVNVTLARSEVTAALLNAADASWGKGSARTGERIAFEYSCPNPFKEMHAGHLMGAVIGEAGARLLENQGARVLRDTYGGDVGPHVAKAMWALRRNGIHTPTTAKEVGDAYAQGSRAYQESEDSKSEIDALNTALYVALAKIENDRNEEERDLLETWRHGRDVSLDADRAIWDALGTRFDYIIHESETTPIGKEIVLDALSRGIFIESEGAVIYEGEKKGLHTLVFLTSRGNPTYEAKDVGLAFLKEERMGPLDASYITTAAEQKGHFEVFLAALEEIAPELAAKTTHVPHGFLRLTTGKMSSREGNILTAADLIEDIIERAGEKNEDPLVARAVAVGAIKYMILRQAAGGDIVFDPEKSLSLDGDSGPYLQYALVRAKSVIAQSEVMPDASPAPTEAYALERLLMRFPEVARKAEAQRASHQVMQYLTALASEWNSFYAAERIRGGEHEAYKLFVAGAFARTMENGLGLLGIPVPERM